MPTNKPNILSTRLALLAAIPTTLVLIHASTTAAPAAAPPTPATGTPPSSITLIGVVRDFRERTRPGGHPDFERQPTRGFGHYCDNVQPTLDAEKKPVFKGGGFKVRSGNQNQWRNSAGQNICWRLYDPARGDLAGRKDGTTPDTGGITSSSSFSTWYRDDLSLNVSAPLALTLHRQSNGSYVFDSNTDPTCVSLGGFFPIEHQLFGNPGGSPDRNFHFTYELLTKFTYDADGAQVFSFRGDDDVWVFVNGQLVIDLGGVHGAIEQVVELNRLGLTDGQDYELAFFFAERHRTQSNFKITTNLQLETIQLPTVSHAYD
jgi:fibro-slime domain-containing protein